MRMRPAPCASTTAPASPNTKAWISFRRSAAPRGGRVGGPRAEDAHILLRIPAHLLGDHPPEHPGGGARDGAADGAALEVLETLDLRGHDEGEVILLEVARDGPDGGAALAEHQRVGGAADAEIGAAREHPLEEIRTALEGNELRLESLLGKVALLDGDHGG